MPQAPQRRSDMWYRGHNDALAGDPPNESYYHYYYDYKLGYDHMRREQQRARRQRSIKQIGQRLAVIGPIVLVALLVVYGLWRVAVPSTAALLEPDPTPTGTPRPTPRPTLTPTPGPTATPLPALRPDAIAVVTGLDGAPLRVRSKPGTAPDAQLVTRIREGQNVKLLEGPQSADGIDWWRIEIEGGLSGWAAAPYLTPIEALPPP